MSKRYDGAAVKRERQMMILEMIRKEPGITIGRLQALVGFQIGLNPKTTGRYVEELVIVGRVEMVDQGFRVIGKR